VSDETLFPRLPYSMRPRGEAASRDTKLQAFIRRAASTKNTGRKSILPATFGPGVDAVRTLAGRIKDHTLEHLDRYLERFVERATAAGAQVHFARDAEQANAIAVSLAHSAGATLCVKSKSMVTEETRLLRALEQAGCETIETDLGEFILQLDHDAPSHIVTPMIHKDKAAVARAFQRELGADYTEDPAELTRIAREHLRAKYRAAGLGITGANFLVAESGAVVICTNEGNGRFCAWAPPVRIVFAGIEKLIPREEHLAVFLKLLARSSTAQPLTVYTQILPGAPDTHIVLVDNGRTGVLSGAGRELLRCIRCGACLNACPVYRKVGGHSYGAVYSGPIGAVLTPELRGLANYPDLPQASSLCGACSEACPVAIDLPSQLLRLRAAQVEGRIVGRKERWAMRIWGWLLRGRRRYRLASWLQRRILRGRAGKSGWIARAPALLKAWTKERDLPAPAGRSFRAWWREERRDG